jgi:hypothetical protein
MSPRLYGLESRSAFSFFFFFCNMSVMHLVAMINSVISSLLIVQSIMNYAWNNPPIGCTDTLVFEVPSMLLLLHSSCDSTSRGFGLVIFSPIQESSETGGRPRLEPIIRGNKCAKMSRIDGRHVQIMLTLTSTVDQYATFQWSHVGFAELPK